MGAGEGNMKGKPGPTATLLRPILDNYMDSAVAVVGCNSRGLERYSCEYDVLVITNDSRSPVCLKVGDSYVDLTFVPEKEALRPADPEHAMSLALARPVRDTSLVLSTSSAANSAVFSESARKASRTRLASSLKTLARSEEALSQGAGVDADFWLLAASYEFGYSWLLSKESLPAPSHLLAQLRDASRGSPRGFEAFSAGAGLGAAGRAGCGARLEGVAVLHDLLRERSKAGDAGSSWPPERTGIVSAKAGELVTRVELAECFSFLGQELVDAFLAILKLYPKRSLSSLASGGDRLIGERLVRQLGLARDPKAVRAGVEAVREQVALLTKKT
jgi:hypothetical protein